MPAKLRLLRPVGVAIACLGAATQLTLIVSAWWKFDPSLSCDRLHRWGEWLDCLQGRSHAYVITTEGAIISWAIAGAVLFLARFIPPYISILLPTIVVAGISAYLADIWHQAYVAYAPFGETTFKDALAFTETALPIIAFYVGPSVGGWLLGIYRRYRPPRMSVEVFD